MMPGGGHHGIIIMFTLWGSWMQDAYALPAFARKYQVNCNVCHTNVNLV